MSLFARTITNAALFLPHVYTSLIVKGEYDTWWPRIIVLNKRIMHATLDPLSIPSYYHGTDAHVIILIPMFISYIS